MDFKCGVAKRDITPDLNGDFGDFYMAGYHTLEAPRVTGIRDPLHVRVMVLSDGNTKIALISLEIVGMLLEFGNQVRNRLEAYGYSHRNVFVFATHTHAGSDTLGLYGPIIGKSGINKRYILFMLEKIVDAVYEAEKNMVPVGIYHSYSTREDLIVNFRNPEMLDGSLHLLKFKSSESLVGIWWTFTAQPEITNRANRQISADYPGLVSGMIEKEFGGVALFGLGLCGAQSPIYCEHGYEKLFLYADELFKEIKKIFSEEKKLETSPIEIRYRKVLLPLTNANFKLLIDIGLFPLERQLIEDKIPTIITKIRIGKLHFINLPGEPFPGIISPVLEKYGNKDDIYLIMSLVEEELGYFIPLDEYKLKPVEFTFKPFEWADETEATEFKENLEKPQQFIGHELEALSYEAAQVVKETVKELLVYKTILAIGTHADDLTIWSGGTLKKLSSEGNRLICCRITDDYWDCVGITAEKAIQRNRKEVERAYKRLGAEEIIHLDYPTDTLVGVDYMELRKKLIYLIRKYKPDIVVSFDLNGTDEENMDHIITAQAVNEACWQSSFDLCYPEHFEEGLGIHLPGERYLFARNPTVLNFHVDITDFIEDKIQAICEHKTVLKNFFHQYKLLARANRLYVELLEEDVPNAIRVNLLVKYIWGETGEKYGVKFAEEYNRVGAGFLEDLASD
jgi:LmbE family N-acetylglucosaminyl deacetylase